tara:strand:- start:683 stop:1714 length:1032 start_codon:yes stop_codon:yes gene_type:complete
LEGKGRFDYKLYQEVDNSFSGFIKFVTHMICVTCADSQELNALHNSPGSWSHNTGLINDFMQFDDYDKVSGINSGNKLKNFIRYDFIYGFLAAYIAYYSNVSDDEDWAGTENSKEYITKCILSRINGFDVSNYYELLKTDNSNFVSLLREKVLPSIRHIHHHRDSIWIRHGVELPGKCKYSIDSMYPSKNSYHQFDKEQLIKKYELTDRLNAFLKLLEYGDQPYAIENGILPFDDCMNHGTKSHSWNNIKGIIPVGSFKQDKGSVISSGIRDHLYAISDIKISRWLFIFDEDKVDKRKHELDSILNSDAIGLLSSRLVLLFHRFCQLFFTRFIMLNSGIYHEN